MENEDQLEFVASLAFTTGIWCQERLPVGCEDLETPRERLDGVVFGLFPQLEGAGDLPQMRLSPKGHPSIDLVAHGLHDQWPDVNADDPHVAAFLTDVAAVLADTQAAAGDDIDAAVGRLLAELCRVVEEGYELRPVFFNNDGEPFSETEGDDVAPGLAAAMAAAWAERKKWDR